MFCKQKIKCILSIGAVCCLLVLGFAFLANLTERKGARRMTQELYEEGKEYDVLFVGSSHMIMGVSPMQLWKEYGIPSYNMGRWRQFLPENYYALEDALHYCDPKLVVIDMYYFEENTAGYVEDEDWRSSVHEVFDTIPFSWEKIKAVRDIFPNDKKAQEEFLFKYSYYHNRWEELEAADFSGGGINRSCTKGGELFAELEQPIEYHRLPADQMPKERTLGEAYVNKMVDLCASRGIPVLLIYLPHPATEEHQLGANAVYRFAQEKGVAYINFLDLDIVDFQTDLMDDDSHLNALGTKKVTHYLGNAIREYYQLEDKRKDSEYADWNQTYEEFQRYKIDLMEQQEELKSYLMLCNDDDFMVKVVARPELALLEDTVIQKLLKGIDSVVVVDADLGHKVGIYIQVEDKDTGEVLSCKNFANDLSVSEIKLE